jgi:peroxiredoxin
VRLDAGAPAPPFTLRDQHGQSIELASYRQRKAVVVMFYPFAFSSVCTGELCAVRDSLQTFESDAVQVLAVSRCTRCGCSRSVTG